MEAVRKRRMICRVHGTVAGYHHATRVIAAIEQARLGFLTSFPNTAMEILLVLGCYRGYGDALIGPRVSVCVRRLELHAQEKTG